jgi:LysR family transcriptional regulator, glycine cleavage system transcriptional activator
LPALRAFEATVRHGSVSRAAKEIGVTDGAVSRAVREMEASLGFDLFTRKNRSVVPTVIARTLAAEVNISLERIATGLAMARRSGLTERPLVLSCEPTFLMRWLIPRLAALQASIGPDRHVHLVSSGGIVPFAREGIDLAIRRADFKLDDSIIAESFLDESVGPVCTPEIAKALRSDSDVRGVHLHTATRAEAWTNWAKSTGMMLKPTQDRHFEHFYLSLQATVAGAGIAIGPAALVADDLKLGALVAPWGFKPDGTHYILMGHRANLDGAAYRAVLTWLRQAFQFK